MTLSATPSQESRKGVSIHPVSSGLAVAAIVLVAVDLRPGIVSIGPVLPLIRTSFGLSHGVAALLTSIPGVLMGLLALPAPWMARRIGRDRSILLAICLLCVSIATRAFAQSVGILLLTTAGVGAGIAVTGSLIGGFIKARFPEKAALMMGIYATSLSFGSTVAAAFTGVMAGASPQGWRRATGVWSVLGVSALLSWGLVSNRERSLRTANSEPLTHEPLPLKNLSAWIIAVFFALNNFLFYSLLAWTATMYRERGYSSSRSGFILASFTLGFMTGNPIFGALSRSRDRRRWLAVGSVLSCVGLSGLAFAPNFAPFLWAPLAAFGMGGGFTLGMTLPLDNTETVAETNAWNAFAMTVGYLVAAIGPITLGFMRDRTGSFQVPMKALVCVGFAMLALCPVLHPRRRTQTPAASKRRPSCS
jgi:CP family cyanate transporter-like MFS transporter